MKELREKLSEIGIEVVPLEAWPGFRDEDLIERHAHVIEIVKKLEFRKGIDLSDEPNVMSDYYKKADPEAEALLIASKERSGSYHMLSEKGKSSPCWFISQTSMLNLLSDNRKLTWQPEAFLRFSSTLAPSSDPQLADRAFEVLLLAFTEVGVSALSKETLNACFGGVVDQDDVAMEQAMATYDETLGWKYGEPVRDVLARLSPLQRELAVVQLANEAAQVQAEKSRYAEAMAAAAERRALAAEKKLEKLEGIERLILDKRQKQRAISKKRKARKASGHRPKRKKRKK